MSKLDDDIFKSTFHALTPACKEAVKGMIEDSKKDFVTPPNLDDYSNRSTIAIPYLGLGCGYAIITPLDDGGMWLSYLWIRDKYRNQGAGERLFNDVVKFCGGKLQFYCREDNVKALRFYRMCGCKITDYVLNINLVEKETTNDATN